MNGRSLSERSSSDSRPPIEFLHQQNSCTQREEESTPTPRLPARRTSRFRLGAVECRSFSFSPLGLVKPERLTS